MEPESGAPLLENERENSKTSHDELYISITSATKDTQHVFFPKLVLKYQ